MKKIQLLALLAGTAALGALVPSAQAQPATKTKGPKPITGKLPKRVKAAIETKLGKPLTPAQIKQLTAANKTKLLTMKAANDKYLATAATITGLSVDTLHSITKLPKKDAKPAAPKM